MDIYDITASALTAQRLRLDTISSNLANANTTRGPNGEVSPYRRKNVVFAPLMREHLQQVGSDLNAARMTTTGPNGVPVLQAGVSQTMQSGVGVQVVAISEDTETPTRKVYDPSHPDADDTGFVEYPNVNMVTEMVDMISATRAYEAVVTAFQSTKSMNEAVIDM